jgi:hypothetical protein
MPDAIRHRDLLHRLQSFETLTDAGVYVLARPTGDQDHNAWQSAANIETATATPPASAIGAERGLQVGSIAFPTRKRHLNTGDLRWNATV